uniref:Uncharacterized protein n=1 Tax=Electrophorus electricus TaxID=8005 RepID=A0A4W4EDA3_ELEEL
MDGPQSSSIRKKRKSRSERDRERRSNGIRNNRVRDSVLRFSSDSEREHSTNPSSSRPRPPRRKKKESPSAEEDLIDGFSIVGFMTLEALQRDMSLKPHDRTETQDEKLQKKRAGRVPNGLSVDPRKSRHLHHSQQRHSDQENRPCLGRTQGRKKKNLKNRHGTVSRRGDSSTLSRDWLGGDFSPL